MATEQGETPAPTDYFGKGYLATVLGSATAGMLARIPCHPIDTVKARLQVQTGHGEAAGTGYRNWVDGLSKMLRQEGWRSLYRGFGITFLGSAPGTMLYFTSYEVAKEKLPSLLSSSSSSSSGKRAAAGLHEQQSKTLFERVPALLHLGAGLAAEAISCVFWVPIDVIKERMQVQRKAAAAAAAASGSNVAAPAPAPGAYYKSTGDAFQQIMRYEGVRGIYRGYGATLASFGPFSAIYFAGYEQFKQWALSVAGKGKEEEGGKAAAAATELPFLWEVTVACAAGMTASLLTNPLDIAKLRLQVQRGLMAHEKSLQLEAGAAGGASAGASPGAASAAATPAFQYRNVGDALSTMVRQEGWRSLFRGAGARMAFHAPSTAITMSLFQQCKGFYARQLQVKE